MATGIACDSPFMGTAGLVFMIIVPVLVLLPFGILTWRTIRYRGWWRVVLLFLAVSTCAAGFALLSLHTVSGPIILLLIFSGWLFMVTELLMWGWWEIKAPDND
jgi:hypothetical protein